MQGIGPGDRAVRTCNWWLRSPGDNSNNAANVNNDGSVNSNGNNVDNDNIAVRPAQPSQRPKQLRTCALPVPEGEGAWFLPAHVRSMGAGEQELAGEGHARAFCA